MIDMKKRTVIIIGVSLGAWAIIVIGFICFFLFGSLSNSDINIYKEMKSTDDTAPDLKDFGKYEDIDFNFFRKHHFIWRSEAYTLKISYDKDTYIKEKKSFKKAYLFSKEPIVMLKGKKLEPEFNIDGYDFRIVSDAYGEAEFPKYIYFFGFNDKENKIAFIYFQDSDLDYIESFEKFIKDYCGWK